MSTISLANALSLVEVSDVLTQELLEVLSFTTGLTEIRASMGNSDELSNLLAKPAAEVAAKTKAQFALELKTILPESFRPRALAIAGKILDELRAMEIVPQVQETTPAAVNPVQQQPQQVSVKVEMPTPLAEMGLTQLLNHIAAKPMEAGDAIEFFKANPMIVKVSKKTLKYIIKVDGALNTELTGEYLKHLQKEASAALDNFKGYRPVTLETAIGIQDRTQEHPLTGEPISGIEPVTGLYDFANLPEEQHLALIWGRKTKHRAWPANIDLFEAIPQIFAETWTGRWATILADYRAARHEGDPSTEGLSRYYNGKPPAVPAAYAKETVWRMPFGNPEEISFSKASAPVRTEQQWKELVLANVNFPKISMTNNADRNFLAEVYPGGNISGSGDATFRNTVLVGNLYLSGSGDIFGNVIFAKGCQAICTGSGSDRTNVQYKTWEQIAIIMQLA